MRSIYARASSLAPGIAIALVIAAAATFLSEHYVAPVMLFALLLGMALNFLSDTEQAAPGIEFACKFILRLGVALLGLRIGWEQVSTLGWGPVALVVGLVGVTIGISTFLSRLMRFNPLFGFLSGGATAICGASAALALSTALPAHEKKGQATLFTVISVSALSTICMIVYPIVAHVFGLDNHEAGIFIGATIHDVAQVVGAGYAISPETGDTATIVKLLRVAMLLPVILIAGQISRSQSAEGIERPPLLPWFVVAFIALMLVNSLFAIPPTVSAVGNALSRWCLVTAIAAIGLKTRLGELAKVGLRPVLLVVIETVFLAAVVLVALKAGLA